VSPSQFPQPTLTRLPSISDISLRSNDDIWAPDAVTALAGIHPPDIDMDPQPSGHRRRRSSLMNPPVVKSENKKNRRTSRSPVKKSIQEEPQLRGGGTDDELSTSEDVELEDLSEEDGLQDDEETGLTGKDKGKRKRKRRRNTLMDQRIAGEVKITAEEKKEADQNVLKKGLINALLIGLWYIFSLSISIVSSTSHSSAFMLTIESTTNGCSILNT
jgi:solute carrier family 35 protein C2